MRLMRAAQVGKQACPPSVVCIFSESSVVAHHRSVCVPPLSSNLCVHVIGNVRPHDMIVHEGAVNRT